MKSRGGSHNMSQQRLWEQQMKKDGVDLRDKIFVKNQR